MKKGDFIILTAVLLLAATIFGAFTLFGKRGDTVVISRNNQTLYTLPISSNTTIDLGTNKIEIRSGKVTVIYANCKNQICKNHKPIYKKGESIVCLPNKIIAQIQ